MPPLKVQVAHDFTCPWCRVGIHQAMRLHREEGVEIELRGFEMYPDDMAFDESEKVHVNPNKPIVPSRLQLLLEADGIEPPAASGPRHMRTHNAHEAVEYAKTKDVALDFAAALYDAFWEKGLDINNPEFLITLGKGFQLDSSELRAAIETRAFSDAITSFDEPAYAAGVYNVPTFFIDGERWAEQPYRVLKAQVRKVIKYPVPLAPYKGIVLPLNDDRPYVIIDMVTTIDGKSVSGERDEPVLDLGSRVDHDAMHNLEDAVDAVLIGAGTLAATPTTWQTRARIPLVMTRAGKIDLTHSFLDPEEAIIIMPEGAELYGRSRETVMRSKDPKIDPHEILEKLKKHGVDRLLILGGSTVNALFLQAGLVDEIFLTIAPKLKLGDKVPTLAGGEPFSRATMPHFDLISHIQIGDELFLRYCRQVKPNNN